jgi:hypothetical protein
MLVLAIVALYICFNSIDFSNHQKTFGTDSTDPLEFLTIAYIWPPRWSSGQSSGGPGSIPGTTKKKVVCLERGPLSLVTTTEELLDRKVSAPV